MSTIITKRNFNVSVATLYKAWAQPEHLKNWWGPNGFTNTFHEFDPRPGGAWRFTMHAADGKNYENESFFETVKENERIVFTHKSKPEYRAEINFLAIGSDGSSLIWKMVFATEKAYKALKDLVLEKNEENLNRLETELEKMK
ncbi:MAG: SRPBCC domain-containing protein [Bacteroidota bacterium]